MLLCCEIAGAGERCLGIHAGADPSILFSLLHDGKSEGVVVDAGKGTLLGCDVWSHKKLCIVLQAASDHVLTASRVHDGYASGVAILGSNTRGRLMLNEIWGHDSTGLEIMGAAEADISFNLIRHCRKGGLVIHGTPQGLVKAYQNDVLGSAVNVAIQGGADPLITQNFIHDAGSTSSGSPDQAFAGVLIVNSGTIGRLEKNLIYRNRGYDVKIGLGADPVIIENIIRDGPDCGIGFSHQFTNGLLESNNVSGHSTCEVSIGEGAHPLLRSNRIHDGFGSGVIVEGRLTGGRLKDNSISGFPSDEAACLYVSVSHSLEVIGNRYHGAGKDGIVVTDGSRCLLRGNDVGGHAENAILVSGGADPLISSCKVSASVNGVVFRGAGTSGRLLCSNIGGHSSACVCIGAGCDPLLSGNVLHQGGLAKGGWRGLQSAGPAPAAALRPTPFGGMPRACSY